MDVAFVVVRDVLVRATKLHTTSETTSGGVSNFVPVTLSKKRHGLRHPHQVKMQVKLYVGKIDNPLCIADC